LPGRPGRRCVIGKKSSKQTTGPSKFAQPYIAAAATGLQSAFDANKGNIANLSGALQQKLPAVIDRTFNNPTLGAASGYTRDVLGGRYLGQGNPYLETMVDRTADDVTNRVNGAIGRFGRTGGDAHSAILGRELAGAENSLRYADYSSERDRMGAAVNDAVGLNSADAQNLATLLGYFDQTASLPTQDATGLAAALGGLMGNYTTTKARNSTLDNLLNTVSALSGAYKSVAGGGAGK